jgi:hypothetical protein
LTSFGGSRTILPPWAYVFGEKMEMNISCFSDPFEFTEQVQERGNKPLSMICRGL